MAWLVEGNVVTVYGGESELRHVVLEDIDEVRNSSYIWLHCGNGFRPNALRYQLSDKHPTCVPCVAEASRARPK